MDGKISFQELATLASILNLVNNVLDWKATYIECYTTSKIPRGKKTKKKHSGICFIVKVVTHNSCQPKYRPHIQCGTSMQYYNLLHLNSSILVWFTYLTHNFPWISNTLNTRHSCQVRKMWHISPDGSARSMPVIYSNLMMGQVIILVQNASFNK